MDSDRTLIRRSEALRHVAEALNDTADADAAISALLPELEGVLGLRTAWAFRYRPERGDFFKIAATGLPPALARDDQRVLSEDSCECQRRFFAGHLNQAVNMVTCSRLRDAEGDKEGLLLHASVPLKSHGRILGILNVAAPGEAHFDRESLLMLSTVGNQFAVALDRAESHAASEHRAHQLESLAEVTGALAGLGDPDAILMTAADLATARLGIPRFGVLQKGCARAVAFSTLDGTLPGGLGAVPRDAQPMLFPGSQDSLWRPVSAEETIVAETPRREGFDPSDTALFDAFAAHLSSLLTAARRQEALRHAAVLSERLRIAADLHDAVSQRLFSAMLNLHAARLGVERSSQAASEQMEIAEGQVRLAQAELRALARTFLLDAPPDLGSALRDVVRAFSVGIGPKVEARISAHLPELPASTAQAFLRVAQEALHNALRHSLAEQIHVSLTSRDGSVVLNVRDDGVGFDPSSGHGAGMGSMQARAASVGADFAIRSRPGSGTSVRMRLLGGQRGEEGTP